MCITEPCFNAVLLQAVADLCNRHPNEVFAVDAANDLRLWFIYHILTIAVLAVAELLLLQAEPILLLSVSKPRKELIQHDNIL